MITKGSICVIDSTFVDSIRRITCSARIVASPDDYHMSTEAIDRVNESDCLYVVNVINDKRYKSKLARVITPKGVIGYIWLMFLIEL